MKLFNKILSIFIIITIMLCMIPFKVQAASSSLHASSTKIKAGDTVSFYVTASDAMAFDGTVVIDDELVIGTVQADADDNTSLTSNTISYTFNNSGSYTVSISSGTLGYWEDGQSKGTKLEGSVTITVEESSSSEGNTSSPSEDGNKTPSESSASSSDKQEETKSSNNSLKSLTVSEGTLTPSFDRATTEYTVKFPDDFDWKKLNSINITAEKDDSRANIISGTGETSLKDGENNLEIKVEAEDGSVRTYTIKITKPETIKQSDLRLKSLDVSKIDKDNKFTKAKLNKDFDPAVFEYTLDVGSDITSLDVDAKVEKEGIVVSVEGEKNLKSGKNDVKIILKAKDDPDVKTTYLIKVNKEAEKTAGTNEEKKDNGSGLKGVIIGIVIFIVILAGTLVTLLIINHKRKKAESIEYSKKAKKPSRKLYDFDKDDNYEEDNEENEDKETEEDYDQYAAPKIEDTIADEDVMMEDVKLDDQDVEESEENDVEDKEEYEDEDEDVKLEKDNENDSEDEKLDENPEDNEENDEKQETKSYNNFNYKENIDNDKQELNYDNWEDSNIFAKKKKDKKGKGKRFL